MTIAQFIGNATRRIEQMFPGYFPEAKHNHYVDYGWPTTISFSQLHGMYRRNGLARAVVEKTILKTWQDNPELWETEDQNETELEKQIRKRFDDLRVWQSMAEAHRRSMVGGYAGLILRYRDDQPFSAPVGRVNGGLEGLAEVIPAWGGAGAQLEVAEWVTDETSEDYGKPKMYRFNEAAVGQNQNQVRQFMVHPDRVLIWSADGTVHAGSALEPCYNALMDAEKIQGAGGEGFRKNARQGVALEADKETDLTRMAQAMGIKPSEVADVMNEQVEDFQRGFDKMLLLQGIKMSAVSVTLPIPEHFFAITVQTIASSRNMPTKILIGNQSGERASTEDSREWAQTNNAIRVNEAKPLIGQFVNRLEGVGILPERDWHIHWSDLTDATQDDKIKRAEVMANINQKGGMERPFLPDEIRTAAGYAAIEDTGNGLQT